MLTLIFLWWLFGFVYFIWSESKEHDIYLNDFVAYAIIAPVWPIQVMSEGAWFAKPVIKRRGK